MVRRTVAADDLLAQAGAIGYKRGEHYTGVDECYIHIKFVEYDIR